MIWPKRPPLAFSVAETSMAELSVAEMSYIRFNEVCYEGAALCVEFLSLRFFFALSNSEDQDEMLHSVCQNTG